MHHWFHCLPQCPAEVGDLVFDWDYQAGAVAGPGARTVLALVRQGWVSYGPAPRAVWPLGEGALRSREDMAALIGHAWGVPAELLADYPELEDEGPRCRTPVLDLNFPADQLRCVVAGRNRHPANLSLRKAR